MVGVSHQIPDRTSPPARRGRGRRPTEQVRAEIRTAAGSLLLAEGMGAFTIERVAALAGASKMTIYKWWPSKGALALEGYATVVQGTLAVPDTGDIEADLVTALHAFIHLLRDTPAGRVFAELHGAAQTDPELASALQHSYTERRRAVGLAALRTAQQRGQISVDADLEVVIDQLWGACLYRFLTNDHPISDAYARTLVDNLLHGVCP